MLTKGMQHLYLAAPVILGFNLMEKSLFGFGWEAEFLRVQALWGCPSDQGLRG